MNIQDVEKLAELGKLDLSQAEKESMLHDMEGILGYVKQIEEVEVPTKVGILTGVGIYNAWREDTPEVSSFSKESIIEQFPDKQDNFLKVKKIL